jgi:hypothetical protein
MLAQKQSHIPWLISALVCVIFITSILCTSERAKAQLGAPVLVSREDSTRAVAFDSVTHQREPFNSIAAVKFGADSATRIMIFAMNLHLQIGETTSTVSADAEDENHNIHTLAVENIESVPDQPWATSIILRLNGDMNDLGDVLVRIKYKGITSNRVRVAIGHVGGGPPDDPDSVPTPGTESLVSTPGLPKTTTLTADDVKTIIARPHRQQPR